VGKLKTKITDLLKGKFIYLIFGVLAVLPIIGLPSYQFYMIERGMQNALVVLSLVILLGYTGQLSLGHAGLVAVGAYSYGIMCTILGLPPVVALIISPVLTAIVGVILGFPSFKLKGPFLVVITIAFGEIVRILVLNAVDITGGPYGMKGYPVLFSDTAMHYFMLILVFLATFGANRLSNSYIGLAFKAIREDEVAAELMGVNVRKFKLLSFVISAFLAGLSGVLFANLTGYLNPDSFASDTSAAYLLMVVIGGMTSPVGAVLSALLVTALPELLRFLQDWRMIIYGLILFIYVRFYQVINIESLKKLFKRR
jgi:branched-chain amino acid transport system permease protein